MNRWDLVKCLHKFKDLTKAIFTEKIFAKTWALGWCFRLFYESIDDTNTLEGSLQSIFSTKPFFGISRNDSSTVDSKLNHARIAITTTVGTNFRLFTNYQVNDEEPELYLDRNTAVWEV